MTLPSIITLLLGCSLGLTTGDLSFLLLHTNDLHAHFQQGDKNLGMCENDTSTACYGGFARLHSQIVEQKKKALARGIPSINLNAGDSYQGTPYYTFYDWPIVAKFVDMLDIDVMSLGNHEFDKGIPGLAPYIKNVSVPIVTCNLDISQEPSMDHPHLTPSYVLTVGNTKVGIIGYLTPDTKDLAHIGNVKILDEIPSIRAEAKKLLAQNVNILIGLGHSGYAVDQEIARQVEEIDLVVGGHSHSFLYTGTPPDSDKPVGPYPTVVTQPSGKTVPVVQAFYGSKYLGYLEVHFDDQGNLKDFSGSPILLSGDLPQDPVILDALRPYTEGIAREVQRVVGYTSVFLDNSNFKCKFGECNIGNLLTDSYVNCASQNISRQRGWTRASIGLNQAGGIRASINTQTNVYHNGSITLGDVINVSPWGTKIVLINITGEVLLQALEFSVSRYEETVTGHVSEFLQVSGLRVVYNISRPKGHRVQSLLALCADCDVPIYQEVNSSAYYGVVLTEFIAEGGDGFSMFKNATSDRIVVGETDYVVIADYLEQHSPIHPGIEGRITILGGDSKSSTTTFTVTLAAWVAMTLLLITV